MTTSSSSPEIGPVSVVHAGIEYPGEVVRAQRWDPVWGEQLRGDVYFRVVFLEQPAPPDSVSLHDARIVVCVPDQQPPDQSSVREPQAPYVTGPPAQASAFLTDPSLAVDTTAVFADGGPDQWAQRLGSLLLARAYPVLPIRSTLLAATLKPGTDARLVFEGLLTVEPSASAAEAMDAFAPALGLAKEGAPRMMDLSECFALQVIQSELTASSGSAEGESLGWRMAHFHGLTYPLATLFTLLFLSVGDWELRLRPGHPLMLRNGMPLERNRVTAANLPNLEWPPNLWSHAQQLGPHGGDLWDRAIPYLRELNVNLDEAEVLDWEEQRRRLRQLMGYLSQELRVLTDQLELLVEAQGRDWNPSEVAWLAQFQAMASLGDEMALPQEADELFGGVPGFRKAMEQWRGWSANMTHTGLLADGLGFMDLAIIPEELAAFYTERQALLGRLRSPELVVSPHQWAGLVEELEAFRHRYATAYLQHHETYHAEMALLGHRMADIRLEARALEQLNGVSALGEALAPDLPALVEELYNSIASCSAHPLSEEIERFPRCEECGIRLSAHPPTKDVESLGGYVHEALREQNQRLSGWVVSRLIQGQESEEIDRFIKVVQVSDLSGLAQVLNPELVQFITKLLEQPSS